MLAAQLNELGVSQGPEAPPRPNRQHKSPAPPQSTNVPTHSVVPSSNNEQNNKLMPQSSSILDQVRREMILKNLLVLVLFTKIKIIIIWDIIYYLSLFIVFYLFISTFTRAQLLFIGIKLLGYFILQFYYIFLFLCNNSYLNFYAECLCEIISY